MVLPPVPKGNGPLQGRVRELPPDEPRVTSGPRIDDEPRVTSGRAARPSGNFVVDPPEPPDWEPDR